MTDTSENVRHIGTEQSRSELPYAYGAPPRGRRQAYVGYNDSMHVLGPRDGWYVCGQRLTVSYGDAHAMYHGWWGPFNSEAEARDRAQAYYDNASAE